ncbi:MAG: hypothetical protein ACXV2E_08725 [Halobacteriota archaeon]
MTDDAISRAATFLTRCLGIASGSEDELDHWIRVLAVGQNTDKILRRALPEDTDATIVVLHIIADALSAGVEMPQSYRRYAARTLRGVAIECAEKERGRRSPWYRNMAIIGALELLQQDGIPPTRNAEKKSGDPSGCEIVAEILCKTGHNISWRGVAEVWDTYSDLLAPTAKSALKAFRSKLEI